MPDNRPNAANRPITDPSILHEHPMHYAQLLAPVTLGNTLWDPQPETGHVGDCGYLTTDGKFIKFFNVFEPNSLHISPEAHGLSAAEIKQMHKQNPADPLTSSHVHSLTLNANLNTGTIATNLNVPVTVKLKAAKQVEDQKVAYVGFYGGTRTVYSYDKTVLLEDYLVQHGPRIVAQFSKAYPIRLEHVCIVFNSTAVASWVGGISHSKRHEIGAGASSNGNGAEGAVVDIQGVKWIHTFGDDKWDETSNNAYSPIVIQVVKYQRRSKDRWPSKLYNIVRTKVSRLINRKPAHIETLSKGPPTYQETVGATSEAQPVPAVPNSNSPSDDQGGRSGDDPQTPLVVNKDFLDEVLDFVLDCDSTIDGVVGNWGVVAKYLKEKGTFPVDWHRFFLAIALQEGPEGKIARLISIEPQTQLAEREEGAVSLDEMIGGA
ncbi:hypothetical protein AURDEDRAFT_114122 [Auricularia subglabra TFB-10046 SS5]|nr:hypothetical protein AURDEDRAFT_114122 [Auricularia subglabra TFB-10046 SS5]